MILSTHNSATVGGETDSSIIWHDLPKDTHVVVANKNSITNKISNKCIVFQMP